MIELIKKYVILLVVTIVLTTLIPFILLSIFPQMLTTNLPNGSYTFGIGYLKNIMRYLLNVIIIVFMYRDMQNLKFKSIAVLILTFFSSLSGIIFFLFLLYEKHKIVTNEK